MKMSDFNNLTLSNIGTWPKPVKAVFILLVCGALGSLIYWNDISTLQDALEQDQEKEVALKGQLENAQKKAVNLEALKQQLGDIKETFGDLLKRLPNKTEVAALLVDISQQGLAAGLEFELFKPGAEKPADFYVELPIQIKVVGNYHAIGNFISGVSDLPRIVTNHDIRITPKVGGLLTLETTAKTYRYMDEEEERQEASGKSDKAVRK